MSITNTTIQTIYNRNQIFAVITSIPNEELGTEEEPSIIAKCQRRIWSYVLAQGFPFDSIDYEIPSELYNSFNVLLYYHGLPIIDIPLDKGVA